MKDPHDPHTPSPEFRASLKHEVLRAHRSEHYFGVASPRRSRRIITGVAIAASAFVILSFGVLIGATTNYAAAQVAPQPPSHSPMSILRAIPAALTCGVIAPVLQATSAQQPQTQQGIPVIALSPTFARTSAPLGGIAGIRELPDGKILVNDAGHRQIRIFDSTLTNGTVGLDSVAGASNSYGSRAGRIVPWQGDSTLMADISSRSVVVLDRRGLVARALALPTYEDGITPFSIPAPTPEWVDDKWRLLGDAGFRVIGGVVADSSSVMRTDLESRQVEHLDAWHTSAGTKNRSDPPENGVRVVTTIRQPVPTEDSWTVLSDGTVAFVRGKDYHVDWIHPDGTRSATSKLPYDWKRLSDEDKQKLADSAKVVWDSLMTLRNRRVAAQAEPARSDGGAGGRSGGGGAAPNGQGSIQHMESVPLSEIPDFYPPIRRTSAMPDMDGNLWILPNTSAQSQHGELVYDVVNPKKGLFERVRLPVGRSIAGFGKGGVVYLQAGDRTNGFYLERTKLGK
jgi:hypothetical protein